METNIRPEQVYRTTDIVRYDPGKVVIQTLFANTNGSAIVVAISDTAGLPEHAAPEDVVISILEGQADFVFSDGTVSLSQGEVLTIPKGTVHSVVVATDTKVLLTKIRP